MAGAVVKSSLLVSTVAGVALLAAPAGAASGRTATEYYVSSGGAALAGSTLYGSTPAGNVGVARATSRPGESHVRILVTDSTARPISARVESLRGGRIDVRLVCSAGEIGPLTLTGPTELRVIPLLGACGSGAVASVPTSGEVVFTFSR